MTVYQGIVREGSHVIHCDRLDEFFKEFIEYRKWKSKTNNFNKGNFPFQEWKKADGNHPHNPEKDYYWKIFYLNLDNDKTKEPIVYWEKPLGWKTSFDYSTGWDLGIKVSKAFKIKKDAPLESSEWKRWNKQKEKIEKVLKDIWTTGKIKDTYGLNLNWPVNQKTTKKPNIKDSGPGPKKEKAELENQIQELQAKNEKLEKREKAYWIIGSLILVSLAGVIVWFVSRRKTKS